MQQETCQRCTVSIEGDHFCIICGSMITPEECEDNKGACDLCTTIENYR